MKGTYRSRAENGLFPGLLGFEGLEGPAPDELSFEAPDAEAAADLAFENSVDFTEVDPMGFEFFTRSSAARAAALFVEVIFDSIDCEVEAAETDAHLCDAGW